MKVGPAEIAVLGAALLLAALILPMMRRPRARPSSSDGRSYQDVFVALREERMQPETVVLTRGLPGKLRVRREDQGLDEITVPALGISRKLPPGKTTTIDIATEEVGTHRVETAAGRPIGAIVVL
jgi:plastocyanin domain-containing protein